ncbi:MAG: hypothetical protein M3P11_08015 [Actinomycetota bacterium]|nr:hypothetical protein [Actinomycetota bacterium]
MNDDGRDDRRWSRLSTDQVWILIAWIVPAVAVLLAKVPTEDLAYQVRAGALMLQRGHILRTDPFTFTVFGTRWVDQQWGAQILLDMLHRPFGWPGLVLVRAALVAGAFGVVCLWARRASRDAMVAACLTLGAFVVATFLPGTLALRPQLLAVVPFLATMWIVRERAAHPRRLAWLPVIALVWANLHGSFVLLPLIVGIAFVADTVGRTPTRRWTGVATLAGVLVPLANPWGPGIYGYLFRLSTAPIVREVIYEWRPLWRQWPAGPVFLLATAILAWLLLRGTLRRPTLEETLGFAVFTTLAIASGRNLLWWSLYIPPVMGGMWTLRRDRAVDRSPLASAVAALLALLLVLGFVRVATVSPPEALLSQAPSGITAELTRVATAKSRLFDGWWGSWFEFAVPKLRMFDDSRAEIFPSSLWDDYFRISGGQPGWDATLDRWKIGVVVASVEHQSPLIVLLERDPAWRETYRDPEGAVFVRVAPKSSA